MKRIMVCVISSCMSKMFQERGEASHEDLYDSTSCQQGSCLKGVRDGQVSLKGRNNLKAKSVGTVGIVCDVPREVS